MRFAWLLLALIYSQLGTASEQEELRLLLERFEEAKSIVEDLNSPQLNSSCEIYKSVY